MCYVVEDHKLMSCIGESLHVLNVVHVVPMFLINSESLLLGVVISLSTPSRKSLKSNKEAL